MNFYPIHVKQGRTPQNTNAQRDLIVKTVFWGCVLLIPIITFFLY